MNNKEISNAIRHNNLAAYQHARYPEIQDGERVTFANEDFSGVDFDKFSMGFAVFNNCSLDHATHLYGQPITMNNCSARGLDLRDTQLVIHATDCDFTGLLFDNATRLGSSDKGSTHSTFTNCIVDPVMRKHFERQGVTFT